MFSERATAIGALHQVRLVVAALPVVERDKHGVGVARRGKDVGYVGVLRHAGEVLDPPPVLPAVLRHLQQSVVRARVEEAFEHRRFVERDDVAERGRGLVEGDRVGRPQLAHDRDLVELQAAREIRTDARPVVTAIVAAVHILARPVEPMRIMRAHDIGRVPVGTVRRTCRGRCRRPGRHRLVRSSPPPRFPALLAGLRLRRPLHASAAAHWRPERATAS